MTTAKTDFQIRSESRGARWVDWVTQGSGDKPLDSVLLVGQPRDEAESNARAGADKLAGDPTLIRG